MFQEMLQCGSGGGNNKEHCAMGTTPTLTTTFQEIELGFVPDVVVFYYYGSATATWSVIADFKENKIINIYKNGANSGGTNTTTDEKIALLDDGTKKGFKIKASSTSNLFYGHSATYYAMKKD